MMHAPIVRAAAPARLEGLVTAAARCWRSARDKGAPAPARLYALLSPDHWEMLVPALDSLMTLYEGALLRPVTTGTGAEPSQDEDRLARLLMGRPAPDEEGIACPPGLERAFTCALQTTRVMIALVMSAPIGKQA
ncbi:hypothetical protein [Novosphingobium soli]|uniref:Uncharacterized protein n=1 Tax=Novosphingobium soli TaxID=574956 RepID=A0ABV6CTG1_9SPHN